MQVCARAAGDIGSYLRGRRGKKTASYKIHWILLDSAIVILYHSRVAEYFVSFTILPTVGSQDRCHDSQPQVKKGTAFSRVTVRTNSAGFLLK